MFALIDGYKLRALGLLWSFAAAIELLGYDFNSFLTPANAFENIWAGLLVFAGRSTADKIIEAMKQR